MDLCVWIYTHQRFHYKNHICGRQQLRPQGPSSGHWGTLQWHLCTFVELCMNVKWIILQKSALPKRIGTALKNSNSFHLEIRTCGLLWNLCAILIMTILTISRIKPDARRLAVCLGHLRVKNPIICWHLMLYYGTLAAEALLVGDQWPPDWTYRIWKDLWDTHPPTYTRTHTQPTRSNSSLLMRVGAHGRCRKQRLTYACQVHDWIM